MGTSMNLTSMNIGSTPHLTGLVITAIAIMSGRAAAHPPTAAPAPSSSPDSRSAEPEAEAFRPTSRGSGRGQWDDPRFVEDREDFHFLLSHREQIRRTITQRADGVDTLTESDDPDVAAGIQKHVHAMHTRVRDGRGIHLRDPLFREVFRNAESVTMTVTDTDHGVRVVETSADPYVAALIQAHAEVVSGFIANGHDEVHRNHELPPRPQ